MRVVGIRRTSAARPNRSATLAVPRAPARRRYRCYNPVREAEDERREDPEDAEAISSQPYSTAVAGCGPHAARTATRPGEAAHVGGDDGGDGLDGGAND